MELVSILSEYLKEKKTDYSLLITGAWGSGKTYFLKNTLFPMIGGIDVEVQHGSHINKEKCSPLYISLFGVSEITEIDKRVFLELNPRFKSKPAFALNYFANKLSGIFNIKWIDKDDYSDYLSIFSIPSNKILCFDDLERIHESILNDALGYINSFIEHQNVKVIIIGDENILSNKVKEYDKIKEKIIRFTYNFAPDIINVFESFSDVYPLNYRGFLINKKAFICEIFEKSSHKNLRTLKFHLDLFKKIFDSIDSFKIDRKYQIEILDRILFFATTYAIEYKKINDREKLKELKHLSSQNLLNFANIDFDAIFDNNDKIETQIKVKSYSEEFKEMYLPFDNHFYDYYGDIADYIHSGFISTEKLKQISNNIVEDLKRKESTEESIIIEKLSNLFQLKDEDLTPLLEKVFNKVENGIFDLAVYPNIFATLLNIEFYKIHNFEINETIIQYFEKGIDISKERAKYVAAFRYKIPIWQGTNLKYARISDYAIKANDSLQIQNIELYAKGILQLVEAEKGKEMIEYVTNSDYKSEPLFSFLKYREFFNILTNSENATLWSFHDSLLQRYPYEYANDCTKQEKAFFSGLLELIDKHILTISEIEISTVAFIHLQKGIKRIVSLQ